MYLTPIEWAKMMQSVEKECQGLDEQRTAISVTLWKLRALLTGYGYALDHGFHDERETNP